MAELTVKKNLLKGLDTEIFNDEGILTPQGRNLIHRAEITYKAVKDAKEQIRDRVMEEMKKKGLVKVADDSLMVYIKDAYDKESLDTTRLKKEKPEIYDEYCKFSPVKESLVIKIG